LGFWVIALLSICSIANFDSALGGVASRQETSSARQLLADMATLFIGMGNNSSLVMQFPAGPVAANLSLSGDFLSVALGPLSSSLRLTGLSGSFDLRLSGSICFRRAGGELEAFLLG
jgi:hypothetical protein